MDDFNCDWCLHPGELLTEYREGIRISRHDLAGETGLTVGELCDIEEGRSGIDSFIAERFADVFGTTPQFWLNLQSNYEEDYARINSTK